MNNSVRSGARRGAAFALAFLFLLASALWMRPHASTARANDGAAAASPLLEVGGEPRDVRPREEPAELKIVSYNIRYRAGDELKKLAGLLKDDPEIGGAHVIGLQEVDRNRKRTGNVNTARQLAEALGMRYAWAAPPDTDKDGEEETGCAILSPFPLSDATRVLLTHEGPDGRRRVAVGATLQVGRRRLRVYSVHAETRMPLEKKVEHWRAVLEDLRLHPKVDGVIVLGDFNTIKGKDVKAARRLFSEEGFTTPIPDGEKTWKTFVVKLKLDWLWLRGLEARSHGIDKKVGLSDHWPLWVTARLPPQPQANAAEK
ncbi:MAG: endonuclease/exonuclease/phosphatase family protein [Acidobacteria bacterium]|nr:endonuclease/exonuclease/phosphatase family protein [Acidobacteriota bacterium]